MGGAIAQSAEGYRHQRQCENAGGEGGEVNQAADNDRAVDKQVWQADKKYHQGVEILSQY